MFAFCGRQTEKVGGVTAILITTQYAAAGRRTWVYIDDTNTSGKLFGAEALAFTYDQLDRMLTAVTYSDDADTWDANQVTKVVREYDGWGNLAKEKQWQEWDGQASDFKYKKEAPYTYSYPSANNYLLLSERGSRRGTGRRCTPTATTAPVSTRAPG